MDNNKLYLPKYTPKERVWSAIENELNNQKRINSLPKYIPSDEVWDRISNQQKRGKIRTLSTWMKVAASITILIGISVLITVYNSKNSNKATITYSEVWIEPMKTESWNLDEDQSISILLAQKEMESPLLLNIEEYQLLKKEYIELIASKQAIIEEANPYSENIELELILTRIELEKSAIVRSLISFHTA